MGVIRNADALATTELRKDAFALAEAGLAAVDVGAAMERNVRMDGGDLVVQERRFALGGRKIFFVGVGKCAIAGAAAAERLLGAALSGGIALDVAGAPGERPLQKIEVRVGTHPKPSPKNVEAARHVVKLLEGLGADTFVLMLVSGGGSSLLCYHDAAMTCLDEDMLFDALTDKGATIREMNTVRKHLSYARGGGLAYAAYPAEVAALIVSDVPGNDVTCVASGPTVKDPTSAADAAAVLARYGIPVPPGGFLETPKDEKYFERVANIVFITNRDALRAMAREAARRGYAAEIVNDRAAGEARELARAVAARLRAAPRKTALLYGGETTVTLGQNPGRGGRNQELALAALADIEDGELILPFASDGCDATPHAGAVADSLTRAHAAERSLSAADALLRHASYDFFEASGDALETGVLESNVSDLLIALKN